MSINMIPTTPNKMPNIKKIIKLLAPNNLQSEMGGTRPRKTN